jgi:TonB family protein
MISDGVAKVKGRAQACGDKSPAKGQVKVAVKVNPDGSVGSVTVRNTPDPGLGSCVAAAMQSARFARTQTGGSFAYPFQF